MCPPMDKPFRPRLFAATAAPLPQRSLGLRLNSSPTASGIQTAERKRQQPIRTYKT